LSTDASNQSLGACMMQEYEGMKHPVMYASKKMLPREQNYSVGEIEALAIVCAVNKWSAFHFGSQAIGVFTDFTFQESQDNVMEFVIATLSLYSPIHKG